VRLWTSCAGCGAAGGRSGALNMVVGWSGMPRLDKGASRTNVQVHLIYCGVRRWIGRQASPLERVSRWDWQGMLCKAMGSGAEDD